VDLPDQASLSEEGAGPEDGDDSLLSLVGGDRNFDLALLDVGFKAVRLAFLLWLSVSDRFVRGKLRGDLDQ
jgi:hypothetical protein